MRRALIITRNFPPLVGGMERLVFNIYRQLQGSYRCDMVGPVSCGEYIPAGQLAYECSVKPVAVFIISALLKSLLASFRNRYQICVAGSGVTALISVIVSRIRGIHSITFVHGLDLIADNRIYRKVFVPFIRYSDIVVANSCNTARLAENAGVPASKITVLPPGVDIPEIQADGGGRFRQKYNLQEKTVLLSVGRLIPRKGLAEFISRSLPSVIREHPEIVFVIIGTEPEDALGHSAGVLDDIKSAVAESNLEEHVILAGRVNEDELWDAYTEAEFFIFPLKEVTNDVEGFGMVAIEAAACGTPTIAFSEGGVSDAISPGHSGYLVKSGDYPAFSKTILDCLDNRIPVPSADACRAHAENFHWDRFGDSLLGLLNTVIDQPPREAE